MSRQNLETTPETVEIHKKLLLIDINVFYNTNGLLNRVIADFFKKLQKTSANADIHIIFFTSVPQQHHNLGFDHIFNVHNAFAFSYNDDFKGALLPKNDSEFIAPHQTRNLFPQAKTVQFTEFDGSTQSLKSLVASENIRQPSEIMLLSESAHFITTAKKLGCHTLHFMSPGSLNLPILKINFGDNEKYLLLSLDIDGTLFLTNPSQFQRSIKINEHLVNLVASYIKWADRNGISLGVRLLSSRSECYENGLLNRPKETKKPSDIMKAEYFYAPTRKPVDFSVVEIRSRFIDAVVFALLPDKFKKIAVKKSISPDQNEELQLKKEEIRENVNDCLTHLCCIRDKFPYSSTRPAHKHKVLAQWAAEKQNPVIIHFDDNIHELQAIAKLRHARILGIKVNHGEEKPDNYEAVSSSWQKPSITLCATSRSQSAVFQPSKVSAAAAKPSRNNGTPNECYHP